MEQEKNHIELLKEVEELNLQLNEARETLSAIRTGQVDAIVVENNNGHQLYTLKSADQTYRVFIEKMKEGAVTLNSDELILYSNSQFATMVGQPLTKVIGQRFRDFIPAKYQSFFDALIRIGWESDSKGEIPLSGKDGKPIPFLLSFTSLELEDGRSLSIILTDLTVQKEVEKELKENNRLLEEARLNVARMNEKLEGLVKERTKDLHLSREHFKFLADNIPVMVWTTKPDGEADYFNKQWYEFTGLSVEESMGTGSRVVLHPEDLSRTIEAWEIALEQKSRFEFEYRIRRAQDGIYRWFLGKGEPHLDEAGQLVAWFCTSTDIEDQRKEMDKKDEFIGVASHELKTPLTSLKGYIQLVGSQPGLSPQLGQYLDKANTSIDKLQHLINDLLDVSKIQAGKLEFSKAPVDLTEMINLCIENCIHIYPEYIFHKSIEPGIMVIGNSERLEQVLMNLISNAVKYSPENKEIVVGAKRSDSEVTVKVTDQGIGLSQSNQKKIFQRFYRVVDNKFMASGLGMGLYISSEIIREHNGTMGVMSKLKRGATFYFSLPLASQ